MKKLVFVFIFLCGCAAGRAGQNAAAIAVPEQNAGYVMLPNKPVSVHHTRQEAGCYKPFVNNASADSEVNKQIGLGVLIFFMIFVTGWWIIKMRSGHKLQTAKEEKPAEKKFHRHIKRSKKNKK